MVCRERRGEGKANQSESHYRLTSRRVKVAVLGGYIRGPLGHRERVARGAGRSVRGGRGPHPRRLRGCQHGALRCVALTLIKRAGAKGGIQTRRMKTAWDNDYLLKVLQGITGKESA